ncbi:Retrovirus-related Pol polyprotein from transposon TNT 1-94 [Cucumis melo var. makuwa]|uniref:Retrovirus-related Pol polyprotein from transposon TNT 1-94 n=1 Tax=Cucumis melo var. makuwa TaxID=1194695 RepID=A0A5A7UIF3_CUCMM|nr:Retrovirus-related Pol polyprotein from transposon TNT 1-94 [Cucumis melo var. makuwa]TYJ95619.1 Retrovirus-related Pol polyprotein from transposon TNT 1-94 [Cucumis melo var. makuwa]
MKSGESIAVYFTRVISKNIDDLSFDELQSSLLVHEQKLKQQDNEEQALKASIETPSSSKGGRGRGKEKRSNNQWNQQQHQPRYSQSQGRGRRLGGHNSKNHQRRSVDKSNVECYRCHRYGHYLSECQTNLNKQNREESTNFAEQEEEVSLLMVCHVNEETQPNLWYLDIGCNNHMCGDKRVFSKLDETFRNTVKFGHNSTEYLLWGKEKSLSKPKIHDKRLGLIAQVNMTSNWMFPLYLQSLTHSSFSAKVKDEAWLWHLRYGHLNFSGLKTLQFPIGNSWRAKHVLELIHSDLCGPINLTSNGVFKSFKAKVEKEADMPIKILRSDRGDYDPVTFEEVVKKPKWQEAMNDETATIERNNTSKGAEGKVFVKQTPGYVKLECEKFQKCPYEHTLFVKLGGDGKMLIVCLYVDDLIYTGNDVAMFEKFKQSMMFKFDMSDLGKMHYFLGFEVVQSPSGILFHKEVCAECFYEISVE